MKLILLRHGATAWNAEGRLMSRTDQPLNSDGKIAIAEIAKVLPMEGVTRIIASDSARAASSADIVLRSWSEQPLQLELSPLLREMDFGDFEGRTHTEIRSSTAQSQYIAWYSSPSGDAVPPNGESWSDALARAKSVLHRLMDQGESAVIVSHGYLLRLLIVAALDLGEAKAMRKFQLDNAHFSVLARRRDSHWRLVMHNVGRSEAS